MNHSFEETERLSSVKQPVIGTIPSAPHLENGNHHPSLPHRKHGGWRQDIVPNKENVFVAPRKLNRNW